MPIVFTFAGFECGFRPDDTLLVLSAQGSRGHWASLFSAPIPGQPFSPLAILSLWLDTLLWPMRPAGYYGLNTVLQGLNCALFHRILCRYGSAEGVAACIASGFLSISPASVPYLFSVAARGPLLSLGFLLGTLLLRARPGGEGTRLRFYSSLLCYGCALFSCSWAALTLPLVPLALIGETRRDPLRVQPYLAIWCGYLYLFLPKLAAGTWLPAHAWSLRTFLLAVLPSPPAPPGRLLVDCRAFLALALGALALMGLRDYRNRQFTKFILGVAWWLPGVIIASVDPVDPTGLSLRTQYLFLPGVAWMVGLLCWPAIRHESRQIRAFTALVLLGVGVSYLRVDSVRVVVASAYDESVDQQVDVVVQAIRQRARGKTVVMATRTNPTLSSFEREAWRYLDPLIRCRRDATLSDAHVLGVSEGGYIWSHIRSYPGLMLMSPSGTDVLLATAMNGEAFLSAPTSLLLRITREGATEVDFAGTRAFVSTLGYRYPFWGDDLIEWQTADCRTTQQDHGIRVECTGADPSLTSPQFLWPPAAVQRLRIRMHVEKPGRENWLRLYWGTTRWPGFAEERAVNVALQESRPKVGAGGTPFVDLYLGSYLPWIVSEDVTRVRLDPPEGSILRIESIAMVPPSGEVAGGRVVERLLWDAPQIGQLEARDLSRESAAGCFQVSGVDPALSGPVAIDPMEVDAIRIVMRCTPEPGGTTAGDSGQVYWASGPGRSYSEGRRLPFRVLADGMTRAYVVRLYTHFGWLDGGTITGLRVDPLQSRGSCCIERIDLLGPDR